MGCACTKSPAQFEVDSPKIPGRPGKHGSSARVEAVVVNGILDKEKEQRPKTRNKQQNGSLGLQQELAERRRAKAAGELNPRISNPPKQHIEGEQIAAGWPGWLSAVAGEAIKGWIPRRADSFEKLDKIGQGTYSNVYKARDLDTGKIVALKKVRFDNLEPESVRFMAREIQVLRRLDHPNVVKLEGLVTSRMSCSLYLVFEYMEHDLAGLAACPGITFTEPQVKCYMQQLLRGLDHCHSRGVLHRDIKGSNLLLDNGGMLKIADFGLATFYRADQRHPLTSRVVTLWYRPPELLLGATEYGAAVDLWSTGCILAELLAGKPIMPGRTEVEQLHKIFKLCGSPSEEYWKKSKLPHATIFKPQQPYRRCFAETFKSFPPSALQLLDILLAIEPASRETASAALKRDFFTTKPCPCDPSSLPQYPPSKELDAKYRDEEARKQRAAGQAGSDVKRGQRERSKAVPAPDANAELPVSLQKRRIINSHSSKSKSEKFVPPTEETAIGFPMEPPPHADVRSTSSPRHRLVRKETSRMMVTRTSKPVTEMPLSAAAVTVAAPSTADLSSYSNLVAARHQQPHHQQHHHPHHHHHHQRRERRHREREENQKKVLQDQKSSKELLAYNQGNNESGGGRMYHSGPLMMMMGNAGHGDDIDEFLEDHERRLQQAARRAVQAEQQFTAGVGNL